MNTFIILLRGINVSGKNLIPMAELRDLLTILGFQNVKTYIQSGNLIINSCQEKEEISQQIKNEIQNKFGYDISVIVKTKLDLENAVNNYPFSTLDEKKVAFAFLASNTDITTIEINNLGDDQFLIDENVLYLFYANGMADSKMTTNIFEKKLNNTITIRNFRTTKKLIELAK